MFKVLLVDDEPLVTDLLKSLIDWEKHGFTICGTAENGEDAFEIIQQTNPHLVITDMKMPVMNGLQLIQQTMTNLHLRTRFIILSAYDDFSYAKAAMRYNVSDYVLKPIDSDELMQVLHKIHSAIDEEVQSIEAKEQQLRFIANNTLNRLVKGEIKESLLKRFLFLLNLKEDVVFRCVLLEIDNFDNWMNELDDLQIHTRRLNVRNIIETAINEAYKLHIFEDDIHRYGLLLCDSMPFAHELETFIKQLKTTIQENCQCTVSVAVSSEKSGFKWAGTLYQQALWTSTYKFFFKEGAVLFYDHLKKIEVNNEINEINLEPLMEDIKNNLITGINEKISNLFFEFSKKRLTPDAIKALIWNFKMETVKFIFSSNGNVSDFSSELMKLNIENERGTQEERKKGFSKLCFFIAHYFQEINKKNTGDVIQEIKKYIKDNYTQELRLQKIAQQFYLNPVYLGQLFKKSTGCQFNEYIHSVRIEEAKKLLRTTDMKISEIGRQVGYIDSDYFVGKFKAVTNSLPSAYKKGN